MLEEVLKTISASKSIDKTVVVSKDQNAMQLSKKFNTVQIYDDSESGVNHAVLLADTFLQNNDFDVSVVFPQDIPFMKPHDIDNLLSLEEASDFVCVVPSRKFDGTNALVRRPFDIISTHYDEDSYKIHLSAGKTKTSRTSLVLMQRIMLDIDSPDDVEYMLGLYEKPQICKRIREIFETE